MFICRVLVFYQYQQTLQKLGVYWQLMQKFYIVGYAHLPLFAMLACSLFPVVKVVCKIETVRL